MTEENKNLNTSVVQDVQRAFATLQDISASGLEITVS